MVEKPELLAGKLLLELGWKLAIAESCTGGGISDRLTNVPGSSDYFLGGIIAYSNTAKISLLGVQATTLDQFGAVSQEVVLEMARGARLVLGAQVGLSVSGIAGPGGGTPEKPVGYTWIGLSTSQDERAWQFLWHGDRLNNKRQSVDVCLEMLIEFLKEKLPNYGAT